MARCVLYKFHQQNAVVDPIGCRHSHAGRRQAVQGLNFCALPFGFLDPTSMPAMFAERARVAAAPGFSAFLVAGEVVEAALLGLLVNLGASDVFATGDRVPP